jgi:hypothetical protein
MSSLGFTCCSECGTKLHTTFFCQECGQACCSLDCYCCHLARHVTPAQPPEARYRQRAALPPSLSPPPRRHSFSLGKADT